MQVTVVRPTAKTVPEVGEQEMIGEGSHVSVADTEKVTGIEHWPVGAMTGKFPGHESKGARLVTTTSCEQFVVLPLASVAVQITKLVG